MRLIDADALIEGYRHMGYDPTEHPEESYMEGWCKGFNAGVDHCTHHAIHAPDIEPRKGKWAGKGDSEGFGIFICGSCGKFAMIKSDFCPNCGADMRGEA